MAKKKPLIEYEVLDDADDDDVWNDSPSVDFEARCLIQDIAHDLQITQATIDIMVDAQDNTSVEAVMLALEGVSYCLSDIQTRLLSLVTGDE